MSIMMKALVTVAFLVVFSGAVFIAWKFVNLVYLKLGLDRIFIPIFGLGMIALGVWDAFIHLGLINGSLWITTEFTTPWMPNFVRLPPAAFIIAAMIIAGFFVFLLGISYIIKGEEVFHYEENESSKEKS